MPPSFFILSSVVQKWASPQINGVSTFISEDSFCWRSPLGDFWITWKLNKLKVVFNPLILLPPVFEPLKSRVSHRQRTKAIPLSKLFDLLARFWHVPLPAANKWELFQWAVAPLLICRRECQPENSGQVFWRKKQEFQANCSQVGYS